MKNLIMFKFWKVNFEKKRCYEL